MFINDITISPIAMQYSLVVQRGVWVARGRDEQQSFEYIIFNETSDIPTLLEKPVAVSVQF